MEFLKFVNDYNGAFMVAVTIVYVIATILICRANQQSAKASLKQIEEAKAEFEEMNRAVVTVDLETIRGGLTVLKIINSGKRCATNVKVQINNDFIENLPDELGQECLTKLSKAEFLMGCGQSKYVFVCAKPAFKNAAKKELHIKVEYKDGNNMYSEAIIIDMNQYLWELIYESPLEDIRGEIKGINETLKYFKEDLKKKRRKENDQWLSEHKDELKERFNL